MCGLFASNDPSVGAHNLGQINSRLKFRGPDSQSGLVSCGEWKLYHSRLSIIAPSDKFSQPFRSANGDMIVFNGEILNFRELLIGHGLPPVESDTAALMALLELDSFNLGEIDGFFAFVRIDSNGRITHCARDRFGVKPLFFYRNGPYLTISSEASILSDLFELPYSSEALEEYKVFRAPVFSGSYFCGVETVPPGTCLQTGVFFNLLEEFGQPYINSTEVQQRLERVIRESIRSRMISDVPVGLLYSGGVDSNLLSCLSDSGLKCLTGGFSGDYDLEFARNLNSSSNHEDTILIEVDDNDFRKRFHEMVALRKEPLSVPNEVVLSFLAEAWAKLGGKVLISGEAADEFFAGYDRIFKWAASTDHFDVARFMEFYCYLPLNKISDRIVNVVNSFFASLPPLIPFEMVRYFFIRMHLPVLFRRLDFALMFSGVEGREPLASYSLFKLALSIGPDSLFRDDLGKLPLRLLAAEKISHEFAFTSKVGFPVDLGSIFYGTPVADKFENYEIWCKENLGALK